MNTKLRKKVKINSQKDLFKLMNDVVFGTTIENERKHKNMNLITTEMERNYLVSEPNLKGSTLFSVRTKLSYYKFFHREFISYRNENNSNTNE